MRKLTIIIIWLCIFLAHNAWRTAQYAYANNIRVENVEFYQSDSQPAGTVDIKFDVIWDNSYADETAAGQVDGNSAHYFDRAWIFVKYGTGDPTVWAHATLTSGGSLTTYNATTHVGITSDGVGAFAKPGVGQTVRWSYTTDGLAGTETIKVRVMGIEMVYIPEGSFWVGDDLSTGTLRQTGSNIAANISATGVAIKCEDTSHDDTQLEGDGIYVDGDGGISKTAATETDMNTSFPTGYGAFYIMKYEVSQGQYRDFLNMLTRSQQQGRTYSTVTTDAITNVYVMRNASTLAYRQGIRCPASGNGTTDPITFGCDLDADGTFDEATDGEWLACNFLSWMDLAAFCDWAGLRPMTELEYEKASRGGNATDNTVAGEYAWGTAYITGSDYTLSNGGANNEDIANNYSTTENYGNCSWYDTVGDAGIDGPLRCGIFAGNAANTGRVTAGASYYGVMELSGNLWERPVTIGNGGGVGGVTGGRDFEGTHGDGSLTTDGYADNSDWPGYSSTKVSGATGSGFRGGLWIGSSSSARVSDRADAAHARTSRYNRYGGRAVRTSP